MTDQEFIEFTQKITNQLEKIRKSSSFFTELIKTNRTEEIGFFSDINDWFKEYYQRDRQQKENALYQKVITAVECCLDKSDCANCPYDSFASGGRDELCNVHFKNDLMHFLERCDPSKTEGEEPC